MAISRTTTLSLFREGVRVHEPRVCVTCPTPCLTNISRVVGTILKTNPAVLFQPNYILFSSGFRQRQALEMGNWSLFGITLGRHSGKTYYLSLRGHLKKLLFQNKLWLRHLGQLRIKLRLSTIMISRIDFSLPMMIKMDKVKTARRHVRRRVKVVT